MDGANTTRNQRKGCHQSPERMSFRAWTGVHSLKRMITAGLRSRAATVPKSLAVRYLTEYLARYFRSSTSGPLKLDRSHISGLALTKGSSRPGLKMDLLGQSSDPANSNPLRWRG